MSDTLLPVPAEWKAKAFIDHAKYEEMYARSVKDPDGFWGGEARRIDWIKPFTKVKNVSWDPDNLSIKWFEDGSLNVAANCIDRHLPKRAKQTAILWEGDDPSQSRAITYQELHDEVCRFANVLKARGVKTRRPRHDLSANDPRSCLRDAGMRAHRSRAFGGVCGLFAGQPRGAHQ